MVIFLAVVQLLHLGVGVSGTNTEKTVIFLLEPDQTAQHHVSPDDKFLCNCAFKQRVNKILMSLRGRQWESTCNHLLKLRGLGQAKLISCSANTD